jgi:LPXTG-motif cell wall-anchored protein
MMKRLFAKQPRETKAYGSIRKTKKYGTCGVILAMGFIAFVNGGVASADEVAPATETAVTTQAPTPEAKPTEAPAETPATPTPEVTPTEAPAETTATPTETKPEETTATPTESGTNDTTATPTEGQPADTTVAPTEATPSESKESVEEVHSKDLTSAVEKAKSLDIKVIEKPTVEYKTKAEAKADEDAQIITIDKAIAKKQAMDRERNLIIEFNKVNAEETKAKMEKAGLTYTGDAKKDEATVDAYNETVKAKYEQAKAEYEKALASNKEIMEKHGLTYTGDYAKDKATVDAWNKEHAGEKSESGLTATSNTTFEAVSGATKVDAPQIARWSIQGYNGETNTDANFDNVFLLDDKNGTAEIKVKGTSHGDVTLRFSGITPAGESGFVRSYVALWSAQDGGIGYGVFLSAGEGESNGGGGVDGQGGGSASGDYVNDRQGWIKNVKVEVITDADDVTDVTLNDIDNMQYVTVDNGLDGATLSMGSNMSQSGNVFTANDNDKSDSTAGILDSNGLGWSYAKGQKIQFSFDHTNTRDDSFSIVGGVFGRASQKKVAPIEIVKAEEPKVEYLKIEHDKVLPQLQEISVEYHKTVVKEDPVPPTPVEPGRKENVLPNTGTQDNSLAMVAGVIALGSAGVLMLKKRQTA